MTPTPEMVAMAERIADETGTPSGCQVWTTACNAALTAIMEVGEKAAELANLRALDAWNEAERQGQNAACASGRNYGARDLCSAIRNGEHLRWATL